MKRITGDITSQKEYEKKQTVTRGLIKKVLKGIDCQTAKGLFQKTIGCISPYAIGWKKRRKKMTNGQKP